MRKLRWLLLCISLLLLVWVGPVSAHANLVRSEPAANAVLDGSPSQLKLWFSEVPEPGVSLVQLLDRTGTPIDGLGAVHGDPGDSSLLVASVPVLKPGIYTVIWKALSAIDGHVTSGGFAFVVGRDQVPTGGIRPTVSGASAIGTSSGPTVPGVLVRWLSYLGMALLTGGFAFVPLVFQPALSSIQAIPQKPSNPSQRGSFSHDSGLFTMLIVAWILLLIALIAGALVQNATAGGDLVTLLIRTRYGTLFWLRGALLVLIGGLLVFRQSRRWRAEMATRWWRAGFFVNGLLLLLTSLSSHGAATAEPTIPVIADWLHLLTMSIWLGGLVALFLALRWLYRSVGRSAARTVALLVSRFSQVATACVVGLGISGVFQVFFQVVDLSHLIDTPYGLSLLAKGALILPLLALSAINLLMIRRRMVRALNDPDAEHAIRPWQRLIRRTVSAEIVFIMAILGITGILTSLPPSREAFGAGMVVKGQVGDLRVIVAANPGLPGLNTFDVYLKDQLNRPVADAEKVALIFNIAEHGMSMNEAVAEPVGPGDAGHLVVQGGDISMIGTWQIDVLVRRQGRDDVKATLVMPIVSTTQLPTSPVLIAPSRLLLGVEIAIVGVILFAGSRRLGKSRRWAEWSAVIVGCIMLLSGLAVGSTGFASGMQAAPLIINPVQADAASLQRGNQIYEVNCLACHGETGAGDGPAAVTLNPPPANFKVHMAAGHTDGQLFDWITRGIGGSAMAAYGETLTTQQRWDVINYIRGFTTLKAAK